MLGYGHTVREAPSKPGVQGAGFWRTQKLCQSRSLGVFSDNACLNLSGRPSQAKCTGETTVIEPTLAINQPVHHEQALSDIWTVLV